MKKKWIYNQVKSDVVTSGFVCFGHFFQWQQGFWTLPLKTSDQSTQIQTYYITFYLIVYSFFFILYSPDHLLPLFQQIQTVSPANFFKIIVAIEKLKIKLNVTKPHKSGRYSIIFLLDCIFIFLNFQMMYYVWYYFLDTKIHTEYTYRHI